MMMPLKRPIYFVALDRLAPFGLWRMAYSVWFVWSKLYAISYQLYAKLARLVSGTFLTGMTESFSKL